MRSVAFGEDSRSSRCHSRVSCGSNRGTPRKSGKRWQCSLEMNFCDVGVEVKQRAALEMRLKRLVLMNQTCVLALCASIFEKNASRQTETYLFETRIENEARKCGMMRIQSKHPWKTMADCQSPWGSSSRPVSILSFLSNNYHCFEGLKVRLAEQKACLICSFTVFRHVLLVCGSG